MEARKPSHSTLPGHERGPITKRTTSYIDCISLIIRSRIRQPTYLSRLRPLGYPGSQAESMCLLVEAHSKAVGFQSSHS